MKVSELAKTAGVSPQTVRYYESEGLLDEPKRGGSGYRDYDQRAQRRLRFIKCLFSLPCPWFEQSRLSFQEPGYANLNSLLSTSFLETWGGVLSVLVFLAGGAWVMVHRKADPWTLAGFLGVVARLWTYHRIYDDLLLVPAVIALCRDSGNSGRRWGQSILILSLVSLLAPGGLRLLPFPWGRIYEFWQVASDCLQRCSGCR